MSNLIQALEKNKELIYRAHERIWANPETGYKEWKTSRFLEEEFEKLGYTLQRAGNIPGFITEIDTGRKGPTVMILGELDSLICPGHPDADKQTGAVHCCGHSAQTSALLGIAAALKEEGALEGLCGKVRLCAVPAEELIEIEYRSELKRQGVIKYMGGKGEFLYRGYFDGVDMAMMVHTSTGNTAGVQQGYIGCLAKEVVFRGKSAHAGGSPWNGKNALYAASLGLQAVNSLRETFHDEDLIRVHPIMTSGGSVVNAIPEKAVLESFVRGKTIGAIQRTNQRVNQALSGAALAIGCELHVKDTPGYSPLINCPALIRVAKEAATSFPEIPFVEEPRYNTGSTDMGDLSCVMPVVHPDAPGATGVSHGADYQVADVEKACVYSAKLQLQILTLLLQEEGKRAYEVLKSYTPPYASKEEYFAAIDALECDNERIRYTEEGAKILF